MSSDPVELVIYAAGAVAPPLQETCAVFAREAGVLCKHINGKGHDLVAMVKETRIGDLASFGAEVLNDHMQAEGLADGNHRYHLGTREPVIIVKRGNPLHIHGIADLTRPDVRLGLAYDGCLVGVWESIILRQQKTTIDGIRPQVKHLSDGCGRLIRYLLEDEVDAIIGWNTFRNFKEKAMEAVSLPADLQVRRSTNIARLTTSRHPEIAQAAIDFIRGPRGREIYKAHGWIIPE